MAALRAASDLSHTSSDPARVSEGALLPFGGPKGYAIAIMVEILSGVATGAGIAHGVRSMYRDFERGGDNGHFFMANTQDTDLGAIDSSKAVAIEIKHDDKLAEDDGVYLQAALLYTSVGGQRRIRVLNLSLNTCTQMAELYKNCDLDTLMNFFGKMTMFKFLDVTAKQVSK